MLALVENLHPQKKTLFPSGPTKPGSQDNGELMTEGVVIEQISVFKKRGDDPWGLKRVHQIFVNFKLAHSKPGTRPNGLPRPLCHQQTNLHRFCQQKLASKFPIAVNCNCMIMRQLQHNSLCVSPNSLNSFNCICFDLCIATKCS